ncbi:PAS domain-containing protein [Bacillus sp. UNC41MFS5]|uniref:PAS domain-containing protein n=1 Tax=Bacillus sp. UNC41MFS5 TaxID=1449046 RepID=UPI00047B82DB|nr:PAS domain-containing protein [Bacillus sp. UNC41MFS5]
MSEEKLSDLISPEAVINFETGAIKASTLDLIINLLPFEMGFCDANDIFRWYSNNPNRVHGRRKEAIGRRKEAIGRPVLELHPKVAHHVKKLLNDFRSGTRDEWEFWFPKRTGETGQIYQKFMTIRDENGKYLGCMDVTVNIDLFQGKEGKNTPETIDEFIAVKP